MSQYWQEHSIAVDFDNVAGYVNLEDYFAAPFKGDRVPEGAVQQDAMDGSRVYDGERRVFLRTGGCAFSELDAFVQAVFGGWDGDTTAECTFRTQKPGASSNYGDFNVFAYKPVEGQHFMLEAIDAVSDLELEFLIINEIV